VIVEAQVAPQPDDAVRDSFRHPGSFAV
jgi:hypothetical protein